MKKLLLLCVTYSTFGTSFTDIIKNYEPVLIDSPGIHFIDKIGVVDVNSIMHFIRQIFELDYGKRKKDAQGNYIQEGLLTFEGNKCTIEDLVSIEEKYRLEAKKMRSLKKLLDEAINKFEIISEPHLREAQGSKEYTAQLMEIWSKLRNRPDTELLEWDKNNSDAKASLRKHITTFKDLHIFLNDLALFLRDFIHSCPLSYERYKKLHEKAAQQKLPHGTTNN